MACVLFNAQLGVKPTLVAYRGSGPALNDVVGGHVDFLCEQSVSVIEQIKSGSVKASGRLRPAPRGAARRALRQGGRHRLQDEHLGGHVRAHGHAEGDRRQAAAALDKALDDPAVVKRLGDLGGSIPAKEERNPATFDRLVKAEIACWSPIPQGGGGDELMHVLPTC